jgi:hypothetical protein
MMTAGRILSDNPSVVLIRQEQLHPLGLRISLDHISTGVHCEFVTHTFARMFERELRLSL